MKNYQIGNTWHPEAEAKEYYIAYPNMIVSVSDQFGTIKEKANVIWEL